jgi:hypothetical protein
MTRLPRGVGRTLYRYLTEVRDVAPLEAAIIIAADGPTRLAEHGVTITTDDDGRFPVLRIELEAR